MSKTETQETPLKEMALNAANETESSCPKQGSRASLLACGPAETRTNNIIADHLDYRGITKTSMPTLLTVNEGWSFLIMILCA